MQIMGSPDSSQAKLWVKLISIGGVCSETRIELRMFFLQAEYQKLKRLSLEKNHSFSDTPVLIFATRYTPMSHGASLCKQINKMEVSQHSKYFRRKEHPCTYLQALSKNQP